MLLFRVAAVLQALLIFLQAILAGRFLSGGYGALSMHSANAMLTTFVGMLAIAAAVLVWRPGGGPARPIIPAVVMVVLETVQMGLGMGRVLTLHVPLGTALLVGALTLVRLAFRLGSGKDAPSRAERVTEVV
ncbi:hypothetical protein EBO15_05350 [Actinomadura harenae]|uniref:Integral membrane protein n=1 Tax=Actinomadura harenae TaxID=2483351 RepID=A0A3M2MD02_9ACTN|nr:hypothetical protein EBO15_05350 [Actinomadura harenae]